MLKFNFPSIIQPRRRETSWIFTVWSRLIRLPDGLCERRLENGRFVINTEAIDQSLSRDTINWISPIWKAHFMEQLGFLFCSSSHNRNESVNDQSAIWAVGHFQIQFEWESSIAVKPHGKHVCNQKSIDTVYNECIWSKFFPIAQFEISDKSLRRLITLVNVLFPANFMSNVAVERRVRESF